MNTWFHRAFRLCLSLTLAAVLTTLAWTTLARAQQPGDLDTTFNGTGVVTTSISGNDGGFGVAVQPDGKIVVAGVNNGDGLHSTFAVIRYNADGGLDTTFNDTGIVTTPIGISWGFAVAVQPDNKIIVVGNNDDDGSASYQANLALIRYTITGSLDTTFNHTGIVTTDLGTDQDVGYAIVIQPDNKIIVTGRCETVSPSYYIGVARYNDDGSPDTTFNNTGIVTTVIGRNSGGYSVALQPDGKILVGGYSDGNLALVRYTITGSLDTDFNGTGIVTAPNSSGSSVALQSDGKIVVAGSSGKDFALIRYKSDSSLDPTFNQGRMVTTSISPDDDDAMSVIIQPDGKIVAAGFSGWPSDREAGDFALARYNSDGSLDTSFNRTGIVTTSMSSNRDMGWSAALQPDDGKIVVAGFGCRSANNCVFAVARYIGQYDHNAYLPVIFKE